MSTAIAQQRLCLCGCGQKPHHGRWLNGRHKDRWEANQVYPQYTSATERLMKCERHGEVYSQMRYQFEAGGAVRTGVIGTHGAAPVKFSPAAAAEWLGSCPECEREANARREAMKPKGAASPCANRACECLKSPPRCKYCHQPMQLLPSSLNGIHEWACGVVPAIVEVRSATVGDEKRREMAEPERRRVGENHRNWPGGTFMTPWRTE